MLAKQAGLSYGQWKALQPVVPIKAEKIEPPKEWKTCPLCGTKFPEKGGKRFCNYECQHRAQEIHQYEYKKRKKAEQNG